MGFRNLQKKLETDSAYNIGVRQTHYLAILHIDIKLYNMSACRCFTFEIVKIAKKILETYAKQCSIQFINIKLYNCAKLLVCTSEVKRKRHASHAASVVMVQQKMKAETVVSFAKWSQILCEIANNSF